MRSLLLVGFVLLAAACGGTMPCAKAGGTCQSACGAGTAMACHATCGAAGVCCITGNAVSPDCQ